jgi:hypothetical protein
MDAASQYRMAYMSEPPNAHDISLALGSQSHSISLGKLVVGFGGGWLFKLLGKN